MDKFSQRSPLHTHSQCSELQKSSARRLGIAAFIGAAVLLVSITPGYAQTAAPVAPAAAAPSTAAAPSPKMMAKTKQRAEMRDQRIAAMHKRLNLTPAQETLWTPVAQAMRDNGAAYDAIIVKIPGEKMSAVDHLKAFQAMADEHAAGLARLITPFSALYAALDTKQKALADELFERRGRNQR